MPVDDLFTTDSCSFPVEVHITGFAVIHERTGEDGSFHFFSAGPQIKATLRRRFAPLGLVWQAPGS